MQFYCYRVKFCAGTERTKQNKKQNETKTKQNKDKKTPQLQKKKKIFP